MVDEGRIQSADPGYASQKIDIMARALIDLFGDRAREVSERQADSSESVAAGAIWKKIVEQVGHLRA